MMNKVKITLIVALITTFFVPLFVQADGEADRVEQYRIAVGNEWYPVQDEYDKIEMPYLSYTFDAVFTDDEDEREMLTNQIDQEAADELWHFFNRDSVKELPYTDEVLDYLDSNFDVDQDDGGFWSWFGSLFSWIGNLFA